MNGPAIASAWGAAAMAVLSLRAGAAGPDASLTAQPPPRLDTITVEAKRERDVVERQVKAFVSAITVAPFQESLARWQAPICPAVAGLPRGHGEFILTRVSQIAAAAGAPLAPENCHGNFYVVVTADPNALLTAWSKRDTTMFGDAGGARVRAFLNASGPVRVWYNANLDTAEGIHLSTGVPGQTQTGGSTSPALGGIPNNTHAMGFRLARDEVRVLSSVIVVVDSRRATGISFGQLADYVAMAGLAELRLNANVGDAPTILQLFSAGKATTPGLSAWDQAFLKALYHTEQTDVTQAAEIKISMMRDVAP